ncbi:undecaprenyldiphospho-muramoylpentapeptide beta-N-acetylglucosaminyltransferase [Croceicoccus naphthovorans]|uniref:UDP-N-acetylglucosamine--N-acetylmuramyl-(pentapeptide) pyrophosphoryl-undecaprenol N-acetylglucosamine transferase n=1 Tax=Croceicoccus naphthovorans TaxID=1348774 RepID=A0A0G3XHS8_9SPHN|nr:undecaprenyldiphospho-muramoylpentapeptide beta-N-acetylglucosaminyltransferase [Croceicoccus naphthovorans]AKM10757.1 UDP-diphospho-muramoylpentapeptide beta-N-acetylglucosaminyltransferase [Croceicoccus naphthovorans]MBB3988948.1 UDP-N-acetylglucosamine--N-acetylmuramyl-(pentapeptide) pyrophosphoryl-undecaprenol N-acetylglucosamine transferase [Croceicoccus naphthovorans]
MSVYRHYVLAAGGTGGHMIPAFALARELIERGHRVALVTDSRGEAIPGVPDGLEVNVLPAGRMDGGIVGKIKGLIAIWKGRKQALRLMREFEPSAVVGFGGYPSMPGLLAARAAGVPAVIHEQNAVLGRVNRLLAGSAAAIVTAYDRVERLPAKALARVHKLGNPVRTEVLALRDKPYPPFSADGLLRVLVTGGSQGASILSKVVPDGLAMLPESIRHRLQVTQQCRAADIEGVRAAYQAHEIPAELGTYFEDMAERLADAHLFIGRAGASTIAELTAVGRPAILIPLPGAMDDHQSVNAAEMVAAGGARAIRQDSFTPEQLSRQIEAMAADPETLGNAAHMAWNCGRPDAAKDLADLVESFGGEPLMDVIRIGKGKPEASGEVVGAGA